MLPSRWSENETRDIYPILLLFRLISYSKHQQTQINPVEVASLQNILLLNLFHKNFIIIHITLISLAVEPHRRKSSNISCFYSD